MIKLPITSDDFGTDLKRYVSSVNHSLEYDNIESSLVRVAADIQTLIPVEIYNRICDKTIGDINISYQASDMLIRSMLHLALYHHTIYLIANIGNEGITVYKGDDSTSIYKYQQDELEYRLVSDGWFWFNKLLALLSQEEIYTSEVSEHLSIQDFAQYVGITDNHFFIAVRWIINEVWDQEVRSRICSHKEGEEASLHIISTLKRGCCYEVVARAIERLAFFYLPDSFRKDIKNEHSNKTNTPEDIKRRVANIYHERAATYFLSVDNELQSSPDMCSEHVSDEPFRPASITENDSFCL